MTKSNTIIRSEDFTKSLQKRHFVWEKIPSGILSRRHEWNHPSGCFRIAQGYSHQVSRPDTNCTPVTITVACHDGRRKFFKVNGNDSNRFIPITVFRGLVIYSLTSMLFIWLNRLIPIAPEELNICRIIQNE
ncbi:MAG: hypothetical protein K0B37_03690 [Bacteroidales bacterium]|nr:hypothetical protein [Bacteroidales bacterium]